MDDQSSQESAKEGGSGGFTAQGKVIIGLLLALVLAVAALAGVVWLRGGEGDCSDSDAGKVASSEEKKEDAGGEAATQEIDLASVEIDSIHEAPAPNAPESWGEYTMRQQWSGQTRVFEGEGQQPAMLQGQGGGQWVTSSNGCGVAMYLVTFKAVNDAAVLRPELVDYNEAVLADGSMRDGWMLFTNCSTPRFWLESIEGESNLSDVSYDVYEYTQSSVANPESQSAPNVDPGAAPEAVQESPAEPQFVECIGGLTTWARFSDGTSKHDDRCVEQAEQARRGESWCGGLYAPADAPRDEFIEMCGREPVYE